MTKGRLYADYADDAYWEALLSRQDEPPDIGLPRSDTPDAFFAYGIFRWPESTYGTIGYVPDKEPQLAILPGFKRVISGPAYITPFEGCHVNGVLYEGITPAGWERLDSVEGVKWRHYDRVPVEVTTLTGRVVKAQAYQAGNSAAWLATLPEAQWYPGSYNE